MIEGLHERLSDTIRAALPQTHSQPELDTFYALMRDYPERGGKQLRGVFVLLSCLMHGGKLEDALSVAAALELFQNWVLVHDDIEDDSDERRGQPTLHKLAGMPVALNVGDALHVYMWRTLFGAQVRREQVLNEFTEMILRTAEGQHLDLSWVQAGRFNITEADYLRMVTLKTAHYTVASPLRLGALCADLTPAESYSEAGKRLGVAFQIRDDVLNLLPASAQAGYGKEFAGDLYEGKRTLILAHLFAEASAAEKAHFKAILSKPRQAKTEADIMTLLNAIRAKGSLDYAQAVAEANAKRGLALLDKATHVLPEQSAVRELSGLLETLAERRV